MLFNSLDFAIFLPIVFIIYWFIVNRNLKLQNVLLVTASYVFYGWWDWRFLSLIVISTCVDFIIGLLLAKNYNENKRKLLLLTSIFVNIGLLGFFKYYNFFIESFSGAFSLLGGEINTNSLNIILPVGISFYTFQTLSYSIDVYKRKLEPTTDFFSFSAFVSFFPQLVAGPIERAKNLLPQFYIKRQFIYAKAIDGVRQILWGFFKKIVIADNCAVYVNDIFSNSDSYNGSTLFLGGVFFAFQIYGDFSGYSDIAIGTSRLFGFNLTRNFAFPYFSRDIAEFWRRWHISLSTWFRDYLYIPLGGSKGNMLKKIRNIFIIFIVSGFWHGANWTFIIWGALNAFYFLPLMFFGINRKNTNVIAENRFIPTFREFLQIGFTFFITVIAWIFFRSNTITHAFTILKKIFSQSFFDYSLDWITGYNSILHVIFIIVLLLVEWTNRNYLYGLERISSNKYLRKIIYILIVSLIIFQWDYHNEKEFIYFQF
jgi:alginate O-acetyltransferase complex protein AlgI